MTLHFPDSVLVRRNSRPDQDDFQSPLVLNFFSKYYQNDKLQMGFALHYNVLH